MMARSRRPWAVVMPGAFGRACACRSDSQLPEGTPIHRALYARDAGGQFRRQRRRTRCGRGAALSREWRAECQRYPEMARGAVVSTRRWSAWPSPADASTAYSAPASIWWGARLGRNPVRRF